MMFKLKIFRVSMVFVVLGIVAGIYAQFNTQIDDAGIVHETFATPISAVLFIVGVLLFVVSAVTYFKNPKK